MTAVASSMSAASTRTWTQRIGPWIRHPGVETPTESVRYEVFSNGGNAAIVWRQRDPQAAMVTEGQAGRPLVSRILLGSAEVLTPELAMAVCALGLPDLIGPQLGTDDARTGLPVISGAALTGLVNGRVDGLDEAAARQNGLELVIAATLSDRDTPLSVELPERFISRSLPGGAQARLLWGLRRTVWPLLGRSTGRRDWSFSTFELPLSDMDPETLPAVVFRLTQAAQPTTPMTFRRELRVRPYEPVTRPDESLPSVLARLLVTAYQERGGPELGQLLTECTSDCTSAERRIEAAYEMLGNGVTVVGPGAEFIRVTPSAQLPPADAARPAPEEAGFDVQDRQPRSVPPAPRSYPEAGTSVPPSAERSPAPRSRLRGRPGRRLRRITSVPPPSFPTCLPSYQTGPQAAGSTGRCGR